MPKTPRSRWGNVELAANIKGRFPIETVDQMKYLSPERQGWLNELYELLSGEKEAKRRMGHKRKMVAARKRRATEWREEMAYE